MKYYDESFVCADIPGLIEGASEGAGLGFAFLRHIERTRLLVHVVDISGVEGRHPYEDYLQINRELSGYSETLAARPQIIALNKCDFYGSEEKIEEFKKRLAEDGDDKKVFCISALKGEGLEDMIREIVSVLATLPAPKPLEFEEFRYEKKNPSEFTVDYDEEDGVFVVDGPLVSLLERNVVLDDMDSLAYMQKTLLDFGVIAELRKKGAKDGDTVVIGEIEFDFVD